MSEVEKKGSRQRRRLTLTIRRDDHIGDRIGAIFLDPVTEGEEAIIGRIREYLGRSIRVLKLEISRTQIDVEVESLGLVEESNRLADAAEDLNAKGGKRNAVAMLHEALKLDPLNREAILSLGLLLADRGDNEDALKVLRRAREIAGDRVDVLLSLGKVAAAMDRMATAIGYLEVALELEPANERVREALVALGRTPAPIARFPRRVSVIRGGRKG